MFGTEMNIYVCDLYQRETAYAIRVVKKEVSYRQVSVPEDRCFVLGFGTSVKTLEGEVFVAYIAPKRESASAAPAYHEGLSLILNDRLYKLDGGDTRIKLVSGLSHRVFTISESGSAVVSISYRWPLYREGMARLFGEPFNFESADICFQIVQMARIYARSAVS